MIIVFVELIVAVNGMSNPVSPESFNVIKLPTLLSVRRELSRFLTASLNVKVISEFVAIEATITASISTVGGSVSPEVKVTDSAHIRLSYVSSTVAPMLT